MQKIKGIFQVFFFVLITITIFYRCKKDSEYICSECLDDFEVLWTITDSLYPFFELKQIAWDSIYEVYRPLFEKATSGEKPALLGQVLNELKDGHANLMTYTGRTLSYYTPPRNLKDKNSFDLQLVAKYLRGDFLKLADIFSYQLLPDTIGYVYISEFPREENSYAYFDSVLVYIRHTKGLIIDIRHNGGGSTNASNYFICRLIDEPFEGTIWSNRDGSHRPPRIFTPMGDFQYVNPTVLLINGVSYSTSEAMASECKKIEHITIVGDTTGGGGGVPDETFLLPSGLKFRVPTRYHLNYNGEHIEWNGVVPDILVPQTKEDIDNENDLQLEYAIKLINNP